MTARFPRVWSCAALCMTVAVAGCGGGGSGPSVPASAPTPVPAATPSPAPVSAGALSLLPLSSAVASPAPGVLGVQDLTMSFTAINASQYVLALEPGFQGTFTARPTSACQVAAGYASPPPAPVVVSAVGGHNTGPQAIFQITPVAAGTCAIKFNDGTTTNSAEILVTVTQSIGDVQ